MTKGAYIINQLSDKPPQRKSKERLWAVLIACSVAAFGPFSFGYCMGYSSAAVTQLGNPNRTDVLLDKNGIRLFGVRCLIRFVILFILNRIRRPCRVRLNFAAYRQEWKLIYVSAWRRFFEFPFNGTFFSGMYKL